MDKNFQGIDRKDVRIVCHFNIPKSMEAFYQESGRAGRDQLPSRSLLYYGIDDRKRMVGLPSSTPTSPLSFNLQHQCVTRVLLKDIENIWQEFILSNAESKKLQSSSSQDGMSKKSLADFSHVDFKSFIWCLIELPLPQMFYPSMLYYMQMVEYCEGSSCRRKKILENFGEQVLESVVCIYICVHYFLMDTHISCLFIVFVIRQLHQYVENHVMPVNIQIQLQSIWRSLHLPVLFARTMDSLEFLSAGDLCLYHVNIFFHIGKVMHFGKFTLIGALAFVIC